MSQVKSPWKPEDILISRFLISRIGNSQRVSNVPSPRKMSTAYAKMFATNSLKFKPDEKVNAISDRPAKIISLRGNLFSATIRVLIATFASPLASPAFQLRIQLDRT